MVHLSDVQLHQCSVSPVLLCYPYVPMWHCTVTIHVYTCTLKLYICTVYIVCMCSCLAAFARFSEAILDYLADKQRATSGHVQLSQFEGHIFSSFDQLFNVWLPSKESRVSNIQLTHVHCVWAHLFMCKYMYLYV